MVQAYVTVAKKIALLSLRIQDVFCIAAAMMELSDQALLQYAAWPSFSFWPRENLRCIIFSADSQHFD